jgi:hypothetical protein
MNSTEPNWVTSSYSSQGNCVQVAGHGGQVLVRDTRQAETGPVLHFPPAAWRTFADQVRRS